MEYPEEFIEEVKKAYPKNPYGLHEMVERSETDLGGILIILANNVTPEKPKLFLQRWGLYQKWRNFDLE